MPVQHYVEFFFPGVAVAEAMTQEIASRDPDTLDFPRAGQTGKMRPFSFRFYDRDYAIHPDTDEKLVGKPRNFSGHYFLGGKLYTRTELEKLALTDKAVTMILLDNARMNNWSHIIFTNGMGWQPFNPQTDKLVPGEED